MSEPKPFSQALSYLLPSGAAWPRDDSSVLMRVIRVLAAALGEHHDFVRWTVVRWQPHTTTRLAEWEEACGLPDSCYGVDQSESARRQALLVRLRSMARLVDDGSSAAGGAIAGVCMGIGALVAVVANTPFRAGHRVGARLGKNGVLHLRVMRNFSGKSDAQLLLVLSCLLERIVPARYQLQITMGGGVFVEAHTMGWPGLRNACELSGTVLVAIDPTTWDELDSWDAWSAWSSGPGPISYTHPILDLGSLVKAGLQADSIAAGIVMVEISTSIDGIEWTSWAEIPNALVEMRYLTVRWTVFGNSPTLSSASVWIRYW